MTTDKGLMVWLPLTDANHCENLGLVGKLTCITTPTFVDGGKLGKCLSTGEYLMSAALTTKVFNNNHLTIAFWVYIDAATGASTPRSVFIGNGETNANNNRKFMITLYPTVNDLHYYWMNDAASKFFISNTIMDALPSYKWTHVAITYENPTAIIYINGIEVRRDTGVSNSSTFAYTTPIIGNNAGRRINDFRLYSYALSPQEIKELSRGKVGHWLGDGNGTSLPNLITGNYSIFKTSTGETKTGTISSIPAATILANKGKTLCFSMRKYSKGARTNGSSSNFGKRFGICWGCKYTRSGKASQLSYPMTSLLTDASDGIVYCTWTIPSDLVSVESNLYPIIQAHGSSYARPTDAGVTWYITDVKLEWGTTPSLYSASNQAFLSDISGFGRHGQVVGNVILAGDTPRYDKSLKYNGGNVVVTGLPTMSTYTISWWDKFPAGTGLLFDWRLGPVDTTMHSSSAGAVINNNTCYFQIGGVTTDYLNYSNYNITANTWCHCCLVCDDSKSRLYINGILKWEANKGSIADFSLLILGGRNAAANDGYLYTGQHSDFRIYATALSADDVKELYSLGH